MKNLILLGFLVATVTTQFISASSSPTGAAHPASSNSTRTQQKGATGPYSKQ